MHARLLQRVLHELNDPLPMMQRRFTRQEPRPRG